MPRITFLPMNVVVDCEAGDTVFAAGRRAGVPIPTSCVGQATCGRCRVEIVSGEDHLPPLTDDERRHLGNVYFITRVRLSCQCPVSGDVTVRLPPARRRSR
ncbi:MAG: ferredoxin [Deltaproteobacteria bacterium]|nr:MAG: ferredoxin [Deltaproteobacteria bacterium]